MTYINCIELDLVGTADDLGVYLGQNAGLGLANGIKCVIGSPRGEDGIEYCPRVTQQQIDNMNKTAKGLIHLILLTFIEFINMIFTIIQLLY